MPEKRRDCSIRAKNKSDKIFYATKPLQVHDKQKTLHLSKEEYVSFLNKELEIQALRPSAEDIKYIIVERQEQLPIIKAAINTMENLNQHEQMISFISIEHFQEDLF